MLSVVDVHWRQKRVETWNEYCACLLLHPGNTIQEARKTQMLGLDVEPEKDLIRDLGLVDLEPWKP